MKIEKRYQIPFPVDRVYSAWVSSNTVIPPATSMDINPVVGGHYRLLMETPDFVGRNEGQFLIVEEGSHIRYTWEWNGDGEVTEIDVTFLPNDSGTTIEITHSNFTRQESADQHSNGWDSYVHGFTEFLEGN